MEVCYVGRRQLAHSVDCMAAGARSRAVVHDGRPAGVDACWLRVGEAHAPGVNSVTAHRKIGIKTSDQQHAAKLLACRAAERGAAIGGGTGGGGSRRAARRFASPRRRAEEEREGVHGREWVRKVERVLVLVELAAQQQQPLLATREALDQL